MYHIPGRRGGAEVEWAGRQKAEAEAMIDERA
jgi:hypothetical protein